MKYVVSFSKRGLIRFVSHLDLMRMFKRALRRTGVVLTYTQGFNPHPKMGITVPLALGYEGDEELFEFQTDDEMLDEKLLKKLDESLPDGITPSSIGIIADGQKKLAASVELLKYSFLMPFEFPPLKVESWINDLMAKDKIEIEKLNKKKRTVTIDIKPSIKRIIAGEANGRSLIRIELDPSEEGGQTPEYFIKELFSAAGMDYSRDKVRIIREKIVLPVDYEIKWF